MPVSSQIREVLSYDLFKYTLWSSVSLSLLIPIRWIIPSEAIIISLSLSSWSLNYFSLFSSASFHSINLSCMTLTLSSTSLTLAVRASSLDCILVKVFLISAWLDLNSAVREAGVFYAFFLEPPVILLLSFWIVSDMVLKSISSRSVAESITSDSFFCGEFFLLVILFNAEWPSPVQVQLPCSLGAAGPLPQALGSGLDNGASSLRNNLIRTDVWLNLQL